jgi:hypothetical protein
MALTREERELFLAEPHIAALSVNGEEGRAPLTVPMWYQYTHGGQPWVFTAAGSRKHRLIEAAGRFSLMVERVDPTLRYVSVEGPVAGTEPGDDDRHAELARRYLPADRAERYLAYARSQPGEAVIISLRPHHWLSADLGSV